jgi:nucleoid-associated protein YgaU
MKLKEAQMLGILALLAVVTVLLCMWGGDDVPDEGALIKVDDQALGSAEMQPGVSELLDELMADRRAPEPAVEPKIPETSVVLGGAHTPDPVPATEETKIRELIDKLPPAELGLVPPEKTPSAPPSNPVPAKIEAPKPVYHVVQKDDTLSQISQKYYGTSRHHAMIQKANARLVPDPNRMPVGVRLLIPPLEGQEARQVASASQSTPTPALSTSAAKRTYTVQKGDDLWRIAQKCYQDGMKYKDIQAANKALVPDANSLKPGMVLVIP